MKKIGTLRPGVSIQPHQERVNQKLNRSGGVLVYHGLGSGKTLTSINATHDEPTDVIVPASLRENYKKELKSFAKKHKSHVMSYEKASKSSPSPGASALVVDEAHMAGRTDSQRSTDLVERAKHYKKRLLLTGSPIRNHPSELAPLINAARADRALPMDAKAFSDKYIGEEKINPNILARIFRGAKPGVKYHLKNKDGFKSVVDGYVDYHAPSKEDFPDVKQEVVEVEMSPDQKKYYDFVMNKAGPALRWKIRAGLPPSKTESKQLNSFLSGARQISNSTEAFGGKGVSPKIQQAHDSLLSAHKKNPNFKGVVYSNFLDSGVRSYAKKLEESGVSYGIFDGSLSDSKRKKMVSDYNTGKIKVILLSGAGAQGLDLKGTRMVQLLEPHWNNPRLEQATGRAIRYKSHSHLPETERNVLVQRYLSTLPPSFFQKVLRKKQKDKSVDQYLDMLSKDKEALNSQFTDVLKEVGQQKVAFCRGFYKQAEALRKEVSTVAVMFNGKMLMGKRRDNNKWTAPGGHLEEGEKPLDGAVRELYEESGIKAGPKDLKLIRTIKNPENGYIVHGYRYDIDEKASTSMRQDPDGEVYRWHYKDSKSIPDKELHVPRSVGNVLLPELEKAAFERGFEKAASRARALKILMKEIEGTIPGLAQNNNLIDFTYKKHKEKKKRSPNR